MYNTARRVPDSGGACALVARCTRVATGGGACPSPATVSVLACQGSPSTSGTGEEKRAATSSILLILSFPPHMPARRLPGRVEGTGALSQPVDGPGGMSRGRGGGCRGEGPSRAAERSGSQKLQQDRKSTRLNSSHVASSYA